MQYLTEINPFFEAFVYLTERFTDQRTSARIAKQKPLAASMTDADWAYFERIADIERELDGEFLPDELMERYFKPIEVKEKLPNTASISLGSILLTDPGKLCGPYNVDNLIAYHRSAPLSDVLTMFYCQVCTTFFNEPKDSCPDLNGFMTFLDEVFVDPQDKWDLMDAATDPVKHIERLRGLIERIAGSIERLAADYKELIIKEKELLLSNRTDIEAAAVLGFDWKQKDVDNLTVWPCLLGFNRIFFVSINDNNIVTKILYLGVFVGRIALLQADKSNAKVYVNMLKMLSDETRFNALHYMRNRYSYGQELADKLKCTRNTMYYHLERLKGLSFIRCRETEYKMLYTMNKKSVYENLTALRDFLTDGWAPGCEEEEPPLITEEEQSQQ